MASYTILIGLIVLIVGCPLAIGSVYIITYSAMEIIVFSLLLIHIWTFKRGNQPSNTNSESKTKRPELPDNYYRKTLLLSLPLFLFLLIALFQLVPLPFWLLQNLSPGTAAMYTKLGMGTGYHSLTLSVYSTTIMVLKYGAYIGIFLLIATFEPANAGLRRGRWIKALFVALFAVGFGEAVYGLYIGLNKSDSILWFMRTVNIGIVSGTFINPDHFAGLLNMVLFCSLGLCMTRVGLKKSNWRRKKTVLYSLTSEQALVFWMILVGMLCMMLGVTFSLSRMGHISMLVGLIFLIVMHSVKKPKLGSLAIIAIVTAGVLWGTWKGLEPVLEKWRQAENALYDNRFLVWKGTMRLFSNFQTFGTGLGTYELVFPPYKPIELGSQVYEHAHNDYLEILSETGLVS
ncbi:MAG TPA: O-antigen ligase family protein, partial [Syntrophorhabdaceae bacterium]